MTPETLVRMLADEDRRRVFAAVVLGASDAPTVAAVSGLPARRSLPALRQLAEANVVATEGSSVRVRHEELRDLARKLNVTTSADQHNQGGDSVLRTFIRDGRLLRFPAQRGRRRVILEYIAARSFEPGVRYPESAVNECLRRWCDGGEADHVTLRRYLVDEMLMTRAEGLYWRANG